MAHSWARTEREVCELLGADHVGGPGRPDCRDGEHVVEVKDYGRRVHLGIVRRTWQKPWVADRLTIVSTAGFTAGAIEFAEDNGIDLVEKLGDELFHVTDPGVSRRIADPLSGVVGAIAGAAAIGGLVCLGIALLSRR